MYPIFQDLGPRDKPEEDDENKKGEFKWEFDMRGGIPGTKCIAIKPLKIINYK